MQLFRFANPDYLYLLLLLPVLVIIYIINDINRKKRVRRLGDSKIIERLLPEFSKVRPVLKFIFLLIAIASGVLMLARPQFGSKMENVKKKGVEVIIALDVSNSMRAEDIQPNRLTRAKQAISRLVDNLDNDKIGLIVFAGDAYTQIPITTDYLSAKMFLSTITPDIVSKQGTAIGEAIKLGIKSFGPGEGKSKAIIIITDGENHEEDPMTSAKDAAQNGIIIHTIGIGSTEGVPVPVVINGKKDYLKNRNGNTIITKLDEDVLKKIAIATGGNYVRANNSNIGLDKIFSEIRKMKKQELESTMYTDYNDQFQIFAFITLFFLVMDFMVMDRKNRRLAKIRLFNLKI